MDFIKANQTRLITPRLCILSDDQKETIFSSVLDILEHKGVRVDNEEGLELLRSAGAHVGPKRLVYIPSHLVKDALASVPRQISLYDRLGNRILCLGGSNVAFSSQTDSLFIDDPLTRTRRPFIRTDTKIGALLCDVLPNIHMISPSAIYHDVPSEIAYLIGHKETLMYCTKPIMHGVMNLTQLKLLAKMAAVVVGGWEELSRRPYYLHYAEPLSPMVHSDQGVASLLFCAEHGIPVMYAPITMGGATAPVTGAGNLVVCIAESLSGLVITQLKRKGLPFVFGGVPTILDMSTAIGSYGAPELSLWSAALTEMAHYLHLPVMNTAGCTDSVTFDEQAAAESAISCLMAALSGANLVHDVGFTESAKSASLELIAATDEFISMISTIMKGIEVSPETLALDLIGEVGPGGHYIDKKHTLDHFRENWMPSLMSRDDYKTWVTAGSQSLADRTNTRICKIIREHQPEPLPQDVLVELDKMEKHWWQMIS